MKGSRDWSLRDMFEDYIRTQLRGTLVKVDGPRHCWQVNIETEKSMVVYNWLGEIVDNYTYVQCASRYIWLGRNGGITVTKSLTFSNKGEDKTKIESDMKKWVYDVYLGNPAT
jgi:hypothetical protein